MRRKIIMLFALSVFWQSGRAQGFYYDAWFDSNRSAMTHGTLPFGENELTLDLSAIPWPGLHFLNIIPYYEWGDMGVWKCIPFLMPEGWPYTTDAKYVEYWVTAYDTKPTRMAFSDEALMLDIDVSKMSCGLHFLNYRVFNEAGEAGPWKIITFYLDNGKFGEEEMQYEYWVDDGEVMTGTGCLPGVVTLNIDYSTLSAGEHKLSFKAKNLLGMYGETYTITFDPSTFIISCDVNLDGTVDVADIAAVIDVMAGNASEYLTTADVNHDDAIDVADIATIIDEMAARARMLQGEK